MMINMLRIDLFTVRPAHLGCGSRERWAELRSANLGQWSVVSRRTWGRSGTPAERQMAPLPLNYRI